MATGTACAEQLTVATVDNELMRLVGRAIVLADRRPAELVRDAVALLRDLRVVELEDDVFKIWAHALSDWARKYIVNWPDKVPEHSRWAVKAAVEELVPYLDGRTRSGRESVLRENRWALNTDANIAVKATSGEKIVLTGRVRDVSEAGIFVDLPDPPGKFVGGPIRVGNCRGRDVNAGNVSWEFGGENVVFGEFQVEFDLPQRKGPALRVQCDAAILRVGVHPLNKRTPDFPWGIAGFITTRRGLNPEEWKSRLNNTA